MRVSSKLMAGVALTSALVAGGCQMTANDVYFENAEKAAAQTTGKDGFGLVGVDGTPGAMILSLDDSFKNAFHGYDSAAALRCYGVISIDEKTKMAEIGEMELGSFEDVVESRKVFGSSYISDRGAVASAVDAETASKMLVVGGLGRPEVRTVKDENGNERKAIFVELLATKKVDAGSVFSAAQRLANSSMPSAEAPKAPALTPEAEKAAADAQNQKSN